jgi:hypothetical protein
MAATYLRLGVIAVVVVLGACRHSTTWMQSTISTPELGDVYVETVDGVAEVAIYRDGRLLGAEGIDRDIDSVWLGKDVREIVDHPRLPEWRARKAELDALVASASAGGAEVIPLLRALPFKMLVSETALVWVEGRPERAAAICDVIETLEIQDEATTELVRIAGSAP